MKLAGLAAAGVALKAAGIQSVTSESEGEGSVFTEPQTAPAAFPELILGSGEQYVQSPTEIGIVDFKGDTFSYSGATSPETTAAAAFIAAVGNARYAVRPDIRGTPLEIAMKNALYIDIFPVESSLQVVVVDSATPVRQIVGGTEYRRDQRNIVIAKRTGQWAVAKAMSWNELPVPSEMRKAGLVPIGGDDNNIITAFDGHGHFAMGTTVGKPESQDKRLGSVVLRLDAAKEDIVPIWSSTQFPYLHEVVSVSLNGTLLVKAAQTERLQKWSGSPHTSILINPENEAHVIPVQTDEGISREVAIGPDGGIWIARQKTSGEVVLMRAPLRNPSAENTMLRISPSNDAQAFGLQEYSGFRFVRSGNRVVVLFEGVSSKDNAKNPSGSKLFTLDCGVIETDMEGTAKQITTGRVGSEAIEQVITEMENRPKAVSAPPHVFRTVLTAQRIQKDNKGTYSLRLRAKNQHHFFVDALQSTPLAVC